MIGPRQRSSDPAEVIDLATFAAAHTVSLTRFAYVLCGDRQLAEDLVQDAFVALYRRFGESFTLESPVAYVRRIVVNANVSRGRRRAAGERMMPELPDRAADDAVDLGTQDAMWRALATLPERQRTVMVLRYYLDLPDAEIAAVLDCRASSVRSMATRAFAALRTHPDLDPNGGLS